MNKAMKISTTLDMYCVDDGDKERVCFFCY